MGVLLRANLECEHCGSSDAKAEYTNNYFCFSCEKSIRKKGLEGLTQKLISKSNSFEKQPAPRYNRLNEHEAGLEWLGRAYIGSKLIKKYNLHFTDDLQIWSQRLNKYISTGPRCILPHPGGFDARQLDPDNRIKYITWGSKDCLFIAKDWPYKCHEEYVFIVEDILSAIRVGEFVPCVALLGTNLTKTKEAMLRTMSDKFVIWLDGDIPGQRAAQKVKARLQWFAQDVKMLRTGLDPKYYNDDQLEDLIDRL